MDLKTLPTTQDVRWKEHAAYYDEWQALSVAQMFKDHTGYSSVKVEKDCQENVTIYRISVLVSK